VWLAAESDDEYYAAEWKSASERNYEFYMLIYSRRFSRDNALHEKRGLRLQAIVIALLSSLVGKSELSSRDFMRLMFHFYVYVLRASIIF